MRRLLFIILLMVIFFISFRGWIFRKLITYRSAGNRISYTVTSRELKNLINENDKEGIGQRIDDVIELSASITSRHLSFTVHQKSSDPNKLIFSKQGHCVGYASFYAATCNYLLKKRKMDDVWVAKPQVGLLNFLGIDIHQYFTSSFFKDHDFVMISNRLTGEVRAVDPTIHDYLLIDHVALKK